MRHHLLVSKIGIGLIALATAGTLAGCDNGTGSDTTHHAASGSGTSASSTSQTSPPRSGAGSGAAGTTSTPPVQGTGPSPTTTAPTPPTGTPVPPVTTPTPTPAPAPACGPMSAAQAAQLAATKLPPPFSDPVMSYVTWDPANATLDGYDACAALGWIVMPIQGATASSPFAIALFNRGHYLGRATAASYGFFPNVARLNDATISVTYHWPHPGETDADASGTSVAQFHFDSASGTVKMTGNVPPQ